MFDPRLQSVHLESTPRREDFRRVRSKMQDALGEHTLLGDICVPSGDESDNTFPNVAEVAESNGSFCSLLYNGEQLPLHIGMNSLGRLPDNDIILDDDTVSRRHCAIVVHSNLKVELYDIASKNGTKLNGSKIKAPAIINDGDEISVCGCKMRFVLKAGTPTVNHPSIILHLSDEATMVS